jgi:hypothetical protein
MENPLQSQSTKSTYKVNQHLLMPWPRQRPRHALPTKAGLWPTVGNARTGTIASSCAQTFPAVLQKGAHGFSSGTIWTRDCVATHAALESGSVLQSPNCLLSKMQERGIQKSAIVNLLAKGSENWEVGRLTSKTVISTGTTKPALSAVRALYSLQNIMMLTPLAPRAGPTGGAGVALPASRASLIKPTTASTICGVKPQTLKVLHQLAAEAGKHCASRPVFIC